MAAFDFPNSPSLNDTHTENGVSFKWDGTVWKRVSATGAQGPTGSTGSQGATGSTGAQGATAAQGAQGATGATGAQGSSNSTRDFYGFRMKADGVTLQLVYTNSGADNITSSTFAEIEESFVGPSGVTFSINTSGNLIMTV